jgi:hypothetical protein
MRSRRKPLYETLLKVKEELMLLGFISLLLNVLQGPMGRWCVNPDIMRHLLPCKPPPRASRDTEHLGDAVFAGAMGGVRRLLAGGDDSEDYCMEKVLSVQLNWHRTCLTSSLLQPFLFFSIFQFPSFDPFNRTYSHLAIIRAKSHCFQLKLFTSYTFLSSCWRSLTSFSVLLQFF